MALQFAHGAVQWLAADAAATTYAVTGCGFQPKALRFYWQGLGSAVDAASQATHSRRGVGFATSPTNRQCVATQDQDAAATQVCTTGHSSAAVAMTITSTPVADGLLDLTAIGTDGFTLTVDDAAPVDLTVFWEAWGGDGVLDAIVGSIVEPAGTGIVSYACGFQPAVLMFAGIQGVSLDTVARQDSGLYVGFATSARTNEQVVCGGNSDDASGTSDTDGYCQTGECVAMTLVAGGNPNARAILTSFDQSGFSLNWAARGLSNRRTIYLAIKGGQFRAGAYTIAGNSADATAVVTDVPFTPIGVCFVGRGSIQNTSATATDEDKLALGTASSASSRRSMGHWSEHGKGTASEIDLAIEYDQCLAFVSNAGALVAAFDLVSLDRYGFTVVVDTAGGVASEWQGYLAFGGEAPLPENNYLSVKVGDGMWTGERIR